MKLTAYRIDEAAPEIRTGRPGREWMDESERRYAYLCLPLTMANRSGWEILNPVEFTATWDGSSSVSGVQIECLDRERLIVHSNFGHGIITFSTGYMFQTEDGHNLRVAGPPNSPRDGVCPLEGIVETDWLPYIFTMNWKLTRPGLPVTFGKDEPFCFLAPIDRSYLKHVQPSIQPLSQNKELEWQYLEWARSRRRFNSARVDSSSDEASEGWMKCYLRGETPQGGRPTFHETKPAIQDFSST